MENIYFEPRIYFPTVCVDPKPRVKQFCTASADATVNSKHPHHWPEGRGEEVEEEGVVEVEGGGRGGSSGGGGRGGGSGRGGGVKVEEVEVEG